MAIVIEFKIGNEFYINPEEVNKWALHHNDIHHDWVRYCRSNYKIKQEIKSINYGQVQNLSNISFNFNEIISVKKYEFKKQLDELLNEI